MYNRLIRILLIKWAIIIGLRSWAKRAARGQ